MSAEESKLAESTEPKPADATGRTSLGSVDVPSATTRHSHRPYRSSNSRGNGRGPGRVLQSALSAARRDAEGSSNAPPEKTSDAQSDPADQDQNRSTSLREEERRDEDRREEKESNKPRERMPPQNDGYHRRGSGNRYDPLNPDQRRRDSQATEEDGYEDDKQEPETGRGENDNQRSSNSHSHYRDRRFSKSDYIGRLKEALDRRDRLIDALKYEKAEQVIEIERVRTERDQLDQLLKERTAELSSAQTFLGKADSISVTEVSKMVELLNAEVLQASALVADSLSQRKMTKDDKADQALLNDALGAVKPFIGPRLQAMLLADIVDPDARFDPTLAQIILQSGLINACALVIKGWNPPNWESFSNLEKLYNAIRSSEGQAIAGRWRALAHTYIAAQGENDIRAKSTAFLKQNLRNLLIAIGWSARGPYVPTPPQYEGKIDNVMKKALEIQKVIGKGITSSDLQAHAIPFEEWFDAKFMDDAYGDGENGPVLCTIELGLQFEKIITSGKAGGEQKESGTILKPKVVLVSALEGIRKAAAV